jgi:hypothetical protein
LRRAGYDCAFPPREDGGCGEDPPESATTPEELEDFYLTNWPFNTFEFSSKQAAVATDSDADDTKEGEVTVSPVILVTTNSGWIYIRCKNEEVASMIGNNSDFNAHFFLSRVHHSQQARGDSCFG